MAYPTCPDCRVPQLVPDEASSYRCFSCYAEVRFFMCVWCGLHQSVVARWSAFTCGDCSRKVKVPKRVERGEEAKAGAVQGVAQLAF